MLLFYRAFISVKENKENVALHFGILTYKGNTIEIIDEAKLGLTDVIVVTQFSETTRFTG